MGYLGREAGIDPDAINSAVAEGFENAMSALKQDPTTGEMIFDEDAIDQIIEDLKDDQPGPNDVSTPPGITSGDRPQYLTDPVSTPPGITSGTEPATETATETTTETATETATGRAAACSPSWLWGYWHI